MGVNWKFLNYFCWKTEKTVKSLQRRMDEGLGEAGAPSRWLKKWQGSDSRKRRSNICSSDPIRSDLKRKISESNCKRMGKKAVLIGCNYPGTKAELRGCINDVKRMHQCLIRRYGFSEDDIEILIDTDDSYTQPTGKNIRSALARLVRSADPGDFLFVHYSGHGTRLPAETGEDDDTGYDECIVPTDMNLITGLSFLCSLYIFSLIS